MAVIQNVTEDLARDPVWMSLTKSGTAVDQTDTETIVETEKTVETETTVDAGMTAGTELIVDTGITIVTGTSEEAGTVTITRKEEAGIKAAGSLCVCVRFFF